jgi:hypothetical protein
MSASNTASKGKGRASATLSINELLDDLERLPYPQSNKQTLVDITEVPASSDSVDSSLRISQHFIDSSRNLLRQAEVLDGLSRRLDGVDAGLKEVEQTAHAQQAR